MFGLVSPWYAAAVIALAVAVPFTVIFLLDLSGHGALGMAVLGLWTGTVIGVVLAVSGASPVLAGATAAGLAVYFGSLPLREPLESLRGPEPAGLTPSQRRRRVRLQRASHALLWLGVAALTGVAAPLHSPDGLAWGLLALITVLGAGEIALLRILRRHSIEP